MNKDLYKKAEELYGLDSQLGLLQEECAELIQAISKRRRGKEDNIAEELADVTIMVEQATASLGLEDKVAKIKKQKLERLRDRLSLDRSRKELLEVSNNFPESLITLLEDDK